MQSIEPKELPCPIGWVVQVAPASALLSSVLGPIAKACVGSTKRMAVIFAGGSVTGTHDTPPSLVRYSALWPPRDGPTSTIPLRGPVKWMSMPALVPPLLEAGVPGTPVRRENVPPPSWVVSTAPLRSNRNPIVGETKLNACTGSEQFCSATVKMRVNT